MHTRSGANTPLWSQLSHRLRDSLGGEDFATWFKPLQVGAEGPDRLELIAPHREFVRMLESRFRPLVDREVAALQGSDFRVLFTTGAVPPRSSSLGASLNPKYRFDNFVVGGSNQFAQAAARAVAENPSRSYNPLFLYGGVGLGKTHLLHAIGHHTLEQDSSLRVLYLPAERFVNELISSLRFNRMPEFRQRYRDIGVLLVDDIQFLANKERTQEEFFHTFNTLYTAERQIILSSDSSPRDIPTLEERLRSRFEWGLIADIQPPDLETKVAILRRKAETERVALPDEVAEFIARQVRSNIRETLRDILPSTDQRVTAAEIVKLVARHYGLKVSEIKSRSNSRQIAFPRQVAMYLCKQRTQLSYPEIGKVFNDKHHSTVMYSVDKIENLRASDTDLDRTLKSLLKHFS